MAGQNDPVSTFLNIVQPWTAGAYTNIEAFQFVPKPGGKPGEGTLAAKASRAARDLKEAAGFARWADGMGWEVYVRMASHKNPGTAKTDKLGRVHHRALGGRANAVELQAFFIDVDVKPNAHAGTDEAIAAVLAMCATIGLPLPSLVVYSGGGGFHAHWVLVEPLPVSDWDILAPRLVSACRAHGVHADHNLTVNPVCLLRIPGTHNRKYGTPRSVTMEVLGPAVDLDVVIRALAPYPGKPGNPGSALPGGSRNDSGDPALFPIGNLPPVDISNFLAGLTSDAYTIDEVAAGCPYVKKTLETGGAGQDQPLWYMAGHITLFTDGGRADFHQLSDGSDKYDPADTDEMYDRLLKDKQEKDLGWPRCATIQQFGAKECAGCRHLIENKSPLNFAVRTRTTTQPGNDDPQDPVDDEDNPVPDTFTSRAVDNYNYDVNTGIYSYPVTDKKTGEVTFRDVHSFPIQNLQFLEGAKGQWAIHFDTWMAKFQPVHITVRTEQMANQDTLRRCIVGTYALALHPDAGKGLLIFMAAFKDQMRRTTDNVPRQELMGWAEEGGKPTGFIYGRFKYNCKGNAPYYQSDSYVKANYFPVGTIDPWMEAIRMINAEQRPEMDFLVATSFGAPLMRFSSEKGVVISAFSSSTAAHKTTALKIGQGVWGSFDAINQLRDTQNNLMARVGKGRIVPTYFDEMRSSLQIKEFLAMIYLFAGGRSKGRLNRNAEIKAVDTWDTLLVGVSNDSLFDHVAQADRATDAGVARIFEFEIQPPDVTGPGQIPMGTAGALLKKLETNYGRAGERYAEYLGQSVDWLPDAVKDMAIKLQKELDAQPDERFWLAAATVVLLGAKLANDINLAKFDLGRMQDFVKQTFTRMRIARSAGDLDISKKGSVHAVLASYLNTHRRNVLATDVAGTAGRVGGLNPVTILNGADIHSGVFEFTVRYIEATNTLRLSRPALKEWLEEQRLSPGVFLKNVKAHYNGREVSMNLLAGTGRGGSKERVIELDLNHPDLAGLYQFD